MQGLVIRLFGTTSGLFYPSFLYLNKIDMPLTACGKDPADGCGVWLNKMLVTALAKLTIMDGTTHRFGSIASKSYSVFLYHSKASKNSTITSLQCETSNQMHPDPNDHCSSSLCVTKVLRPFDRREPTVGNLHLDTFLYGYNASVNNRCL